MRSLLLQRLKFSIPNEITVICNNCSNYDYHFIMKELEKEFGRQFTCSGKNIENHLTFSVPMEKEVNRIGKNGEDVTKPYLTN